MVCRLFVIILFHKEAGTTEIEKKKINKNGVRTKTTFLSVQYKEYNDDTRSFLFIYTLFFKSSAMCGRYQQKKECSFRFDSESRERLYEIEEDKKSRELEISMIFVA